MNLAIIIGISAYQHATPLKACKNDAILFHDVLKKIKKTDDILFLGDSPQGYVAKKQISDFITKHKEETVDELIFYYTGHGERYGDDFFYLFSDFKEDKKETTGLRNSELDGFFRNISPKLTIKIVDACYSGGVYIKGQPEMQTVLEKSAKENRLKDVYFLYSSRDNEASWADKDYSYFSKSIFKSLIDNDGPIRYRDIMAYIADDSEASGTPKPVFIVQADNTEIFGVSTKEVQEHINSKLCIDDETKDKNHHEASQVEEQKPLLELVKSKSINEYCTEEEALKTLDLIKSEFGDVNNWPDDIASIFELKNELIANTEIIPNKLELGRWVKKNYPNGYFAKANYETEHFEIEEYKELPQKPISKNHLGLSSTIARMSSLFGNNSPEYRLETVEKSRRVIDGYELTHKSDYSAIRIDFIPKYNSLNRYTLYIALIYSRKNIAIHYSYEKLRDFNWEDFSSPQCHTWKNKITLLKDTENAGVIVRNLINECSCWIIDGIKQDVS